MYKEASGIFLNGLVLIGTDLDPSYQLQNLLNIEKKLKRIRKIKYGDRTIDLDLIYVIKTCDFKPVVRKGYDFDYKTCDLVVPHPEMDKRCFVFVPFINICMIYPMIFFKSKHSLDLILNIKKNYDKNINPKNHNSLINNQYTKESWYIDKTKLSLFTI